MKRGLFITLEGTEGCGKSTQASLLAERLRAEGFTVRALREPGGTPLGEEIRHTLKHSAAGRGMTPEAELLLMNAARAQLVRQVIRPSLEAGEIVVCDRFLDSTLAYQGWGRGLDLDRVRDVVALAVDGTIPDLTLLFEASREVSEARRRDREVVADRFELEGAAFFDRVATGFRVIAAAEPGRVRVIDATPSVAEVAAAVWEAILLKAAEPRTRPSIRITDCGGRG